MKFIRFAADKFYSIILREYIEKNSSNNVTVEAVFGKTIATTCHNIATMFVDKDLKQKKLDSARLFIPALLDFANPKIEPAQEKLNKEGTISSRKALAEKIAAEKQKVTKIREHHKEQHDVGEYDKFLNAFIKSLDDIAIFDEENQTFEEGMETKKTVLYNRLLAMIMQEYLNVRIERWLAPEDSVEKNTLQKLSDKLKEKFDKLKAKATDDLEIMVESILFSVKEITEPNKINCDKTVNAFNAMLTDIRASDRSAKEADLKHGADNSVNKAGIDAGGKTAEESERDRKRVAEDAEGEAALRRAHEKLTSINAIRNPKFDAQFAAGEEYRVRGVAELPSVNSVQVIHDPTLIFSTKVLNGGADAKALQVITVLSAAVTADTKESNHANNNGIKTKQINGTNHSTETVVPSAAAKPNASAPQPAELVVAATSAANNPHGAKKRKNKKKKNNAKFNG